MTYPQAVPVNLPRSLPTKPERLPPSTHIYRAAAVHLRAQLTRSFIDKTFHQLYGEDKPTEIILRSATNPAMISSPGWAQELAGRAVLDLIIQLAPVSAGASLIARGLLVNMDGIGQLTIPSFIVGPQDAGKFVGEGQPAPARKYNLTADAKLEPKKISVITAFSHETANSSNFEQIIRSVLNRVAAISLDKYLFDAAAGDSIRPPGLLHGVTPIVATTGGASAAMIADVGALVGALSASGGGVDPVLIGNAALTARLMLLAPPQFAIPVFAASLLPDDTLIAVDAAAFVSGFDPVPTFFTDDVPALHEEDTTPLSIGTSGTPATVAAPTRSLWQTDCLSLKMNLNCSWAMRSSGLVQWIEGVSW